MGMLHRLSGKVLLLHEGEIELPTDIAGICYIDVTAGIEASGEQIRREISMLI
jgi:predicted nucleotide-binding protein